MLLHIWFSTTSSIAGHPNDKSWAIQILSWMPPRRLWWFKCQNQPTYSRCRSSHLRITQKVSGWRAAYKMMVAVYKSVIRTILLYWRKSWTMDKRHGEKSLREFLEFLGKFTEIPVLEIFGENSLKSLGKSLKSLENTLKSLEKFCEISGKITWNY